MQICLNAKIIDPRKQAIQEISDHLRGKIICGLDTETTGLLSEDHRIVEIYAGLWKDGKKIFEFDQRVNPERTITAEAERVHGISFSDVKFSPVWSKVGPTVQKILDKSDFMVAHNGLWFDYEMLRFEQTRIGLQINKIPVFDTMNEGVWATPVGKKPKLQELCFACGVEYDVTKSHAASYDVDVMMECFHKGAKFGFFDARESVTPS